MQKAGCSTFRQAILPSIFAKQFCSVCGQISYDQELVTFFAKPSKPSSDPPKWSQNRAKIDPKSIWNPSWTAFGPQMAPKSIQESSKKCPRGGQERPRTAQGRPRPPKNRPRNTLERPKPVQNRPRRGPRRKLARSTKEVLLERPWKQSFVVFVPGVQHVRHAKNHGKT